MNSPTAILPTSALIDRITGPIRSIRSFPALDGQPSSYVCEVAEVADMRRVGSWPADRIAAGTSFGDPEAARNAAIGEAVERYCGNFIPFGLHQASLAELRSDGIDHLSVDELPSFATWQYQRPKFPYRPLTDDLRLQWIQGECGGKTCMVPAALVICNWYRDTSEPRVFHLNYSGIATGVSAVDAYRRALLETIERDAATLWWGLNLPAIALNPSSIDGLSQAWSGSRLSLNVVALPVDSPVSVMAALACDKDLGLVGAGFASRLDPAEAAKKAALEAVQVWLVQRGLIDKDGASLKAVEAGILAKHTYFPFRQERDYLADAGEDFRDVVDLASHGQIWLDTRMHSMLDRFQPTPSVDIGGISAPDVSDAKHLIDIEESLASRGHRIVNVDLTTSDIRQTHLRVSRVVVGGLLPNTPAAFGYYGSPRWLTVAKRFGLAPNTDQTDLRSLLTFAPPPHL